MRQACFSFILFIHLKEKHRERIKIMMSADKKKIKLPNMTEDKMKKIEARKRRLGKVLRENLKRRKNFREKSGKQSIVN